MAERSKLKGFRNDYLIIAFITFVLFLAVNLVFLCVDDPFVKQLSDLDAKWKDSYDFSVKVRTKEWVTIAKQLDDYKGLSDQDFLVLHSEGGEPFPHPVLEYMNLPTMNKFYESTLEGARVNRNGQQLSAAELNFGTWMFGGSTMWGWLNSNENTIPAKLQNLASSDFPRPINFGVNGGDLGYVTHKLDLLLKKGYRPRRVIVMLGLNEMFKSVSPFDVAEIPTRNSFYVAMLVPPSNTFEFSLMKASSIKAGLSFLPAVSYFRSRAGAQRVRELSEREPLCSFDSKNYSIEYRQTKIDMCDRWMIGAITQDKDEQLKRLKSYYLLNLSYIRELGRRYDFLVNFFYQPIGYLDQDNIFLNKSYGGSILRFANEFERHVLEDRAISDIGLVDLRKCVAADPKQRYTDIGHYSSTTNEVIARCMLMSIGGKGRQ